MNNKKTHVKTGRLPANWVFTLLLTLQEIHQTDSMYMERKLESLTRRDHQQQNKIRIFYFFFDTFFLFFLSFHSVFAQSYRENAHTHSWDNKFSSNSSHYFYMWYLNTSTGTYDEWNDENAGKHPRKYEWGKQAYRTQKKITSRTDERKKINEFEAKWSKRVFISAEKETARNVKSCKIISCTCWKNILRFSAYTHKHTFRNFHVFIVDVWAQNVLRNKSPLFLTHNSTIVRTIFTLPIFIKSFLSATAFFPGSVRPRRHRFEFIWRDGKCVHTFYLLYSKLISISWRHACEWFLSLDSFFRLLFFFCLSYLFIFVYISRCFMMRKIFFFCALGREQNYNLFCRNNVKHLTWIFIWRFYFRLSVPNTEKKTQRLLYFNMYMETWRAAHADESQFIMVEKKTVPQMSRLFIKQSANKLNKFHYMCGRCCVRSKCAHCNQIELWKQNSLS